MTETTVRYASSIEARAIRSGLADKTPHVVPFAPRAPAAGPDWRYRRLVGDRAWGALPNEVQRRFSKRLRPGEATVYRGEVVLTELSTVGWLISQAARLIGGPLPFTADATGPAVVTVTEEPALSGQIWSRQYPCPGGFPQVIHSAKRFSGPTGLEEYLARFLGLGLVMRLTIHVEDRSLVFRSAGYALEIGGYAVSLQAQPRATKDLDFVSEPRCC